MVSSRIPPPNDISMSFPKGAGALVTKRMTVIGPREGEEEQRFGSS